MVRDGRGNTAFTEKPNKTNKKKNYTMFTETNNNKKNFISNKTKINTDR